MPLRIVLLLLIGFCGYTYAETCQKCPTKWTHFNGYCYRFFGIPKGWRDAQAFCESVGSLGFSYGSAYQSADLASIHSQREQNFINSYWKTVRTDRFVHIGLNDPQRNDQFQWSDGTPVDYRNWASGEPDLNSGQQFVALTSSGQWADVNPSKLAFICKMPLASD